MQKTFLLLQYSIAFIRFKYTWYIGLYCTFELYYYICLYSTLSCNLTEAKDVVAVGEVVVAVVEGEEGDGVMGV